MMIFQDDNGANDNVPATFPLEGEGESAKWNKEVIEKRAKKEHLRSTFFRKREGKKCSFS